MTPTPNAIPHGEAGTVFAGGGKHYRLDFYSNSPEFQGPARPDTREGTRYPLLPHALIVP